MNRKRKEKATGVKWDSESKGRGEKQYAQLKKHQV